MIVAIRIARPCGAMRVLRAAGRVFNFEPLATPVRVENIR
jgi:hypothetical protein